MTADTAATSVVSVDAHPAVLKLRAHFPDLELSVSVQHRQTTITVAREHLIEVVEFLKYDPDLAFNQLVDITCADFLVRAPRFEVIYTCVSIPRGDRLWLKVPLLDGDEHVPSLASVYLSANGAEREVYDLMGIIFDGHPNLRRILLPDHWQGHPLRRDHPIGGEEVAFTS